MRIGYSGTDFTENRAIRRRGTAGAVRDPTGRRARDQEPAMTTVTVTPPFQVNHKGIILGPGATVDVPDEVAREWFAFGWVEKAKAAAPAKKR